MSDLNSLVFSKEEQEKGLLNDFINILLKINRESFDHHIEFLIRQEEDLVIVEWSQISYNSEGDYSHFKLVGPDQVVMLEYRFPDNHFEYVFDEEDGKERLKEWLEENPGWEKSLNGVWYNKIENDRLRKEFGLDKEGDE